jgi:hypothetical protein
MKNYIKWIFLTICVGGLTAQFSTMPALPGSRKDVPLTYITSPVSNPDYLVKTIGHQKTILGCIAANRNTDPPPVLILYVDGTVGASIVLPNATDVKYKISKVPVAVAGKIPTPIDGASEGGLLTITLPKAQLKDALSGGVDIAGTFIGGAEMKQLFALDTECLKGIK